MLKRKKFLEEIVIQDGYTMNGEEISYYFIKKDGTKATRQNIYNILENAMKKVYIKVKLWNNLKPFETAVMISEMFKIETNDFPFFFRTFPIEIRKKIEKDARKRIPKKLLEG